MGDFFATMAFVFPGLWNVTENTTVKKAKMKEIAVSNQIISRKNIQQV